MMLCISCHANFPENDTLEHFRTGRRIAYDPLRGRLWAVCGACQRWTLAAIETRWEAVEELERLLGGGAKLLGQSTNIALLQTGDVEVVRVGRASLREEAWWRFGREAQRRYLDGQRIVRRGKWQEAIATMLFLGIPIWGFSRPERWLREARAERFGDALCLGDAKCGFCGSLSTGVRFSDPLVLQLERPGVVRLATPCPQCGDASPRTRLTPEVSARMLRRALAYHNFAGATEQQVNDAAGLIAPLASPGELIVKLAERQTDVRALGARDRLALEIATSETSERAALAEELSDLEAAWTAAEEIAQIADGELTPLPALDRLRSRSE